MRPLARSSTWAAALLLGALTVAATAIAPLAPPAPESRQFDFWLGTWSVNNRRLQAGGAWRDEGRAVARIDSILGGRAVLERWTGQGGYPIFGFSVRAWEPNRERWVIVLNWPGGGRAPRFSAMEGTFRHGRGAFFPPGYDGTWPQVTRFTFSDGLADSCRWDMAQTTDGGESWRTSWIMEFSRIGDPHALDATNAPVDLPPASSPCTDSRARAHDAIVGAWSGTLRERSPDGTWREGTARFRASSMIKGCGALHFLDGTVDGATTHRFLATAFDFGAETWNGRFIDDQVPRIRALSGAPGDALVLAEEGDRGDRRRITLTHDANTVRWIEEVRTSSDAWERTLEVDLERDPA